MKENIIQLDEGKWQYNSNQAFLLSNGETLSSLSLVYETYGKLNSQKSNAILINHALSTSSHLRSHHENDSKGWWEKMVGPNCPIDTNHYFVICINNIGSCHGSSGPTTINPNNHKPYGNTFPGISIHDISHSQFELISYLGIESLYAVIGPSMGAMISLDFACHYPLHVKHLISISSCYRSYPSNIGIRTIQREIIRLDPQWQNGDFNHPLPGFITARKLAHLTYRNTEELNHRFIKLEQDQHDHRTMNSYLEYNAEKFTKNFDVNSYLLLTKAMDDFNIAPDHLNPQQFVKEIKAKTLILSVTSDTLFEPFQQQELFELLQNANVNAHYESYTSDYGHDSFLVEIQGIGNIIQNFLH